jgi:hypothetical protein
MEPQGQQGLAAQGQSQQGQMQQQGQMTVEMVVKALMEGARPEELVQMGVPQQMVEQAMMMLQQQSQPEARPGLAGAQLPTQGL